MDHKSQSELRDALFTDWPRLRASNQLNMLLPGCGTTQWVRKDGVVGYVTLDYQLRRDVQIPRAPNELGAPESVDLVEKYWAVRTRDGRQDPTWLPSLNVNVITVRNAPVTSDDCECAIRHAVRVRDAVWRTAKEWPREPKRAEVYTRAAIIGPRLHEDAAVLAAVDSIRHIPFTMARYAMNETSEFEFSATEVARFASLNHGGDIESQKIGESLVSADELPAVSFQWTGVNSSPVERDAMHRAI